MIGDETEQTNTRDLFRSSAKRYSRKEDTKIKKTKCVTASLTKAMTTERQLNSYTRSTRSYVICVKADVKSAPKIFTVTLLP